MRNPDLLTELLERVADHTATPREVLFRVEEELRLEFGGTKQYIRGRVDLREHIQQIGASIPPEARSKTVKTLVKTLGVDRSTVYRHLKVRNTSGSNNA